MPIGIFRQSTATARSGRLGAVAIPRLRARGGELRASVAEHGAPLVTRTRSGWRSSSGVSVGMKPAGAAPALYASNRERPFPQSQSDRTSISKCSGVSACRKAWESKTAPGDWAPLLWAVAPSRMRSTASHTSGAVKA
jgi:hypothetical protein